VAPTTLEALIAGTFEAKHVRAALQHYGEMQTAFQRGDWEKGIGRGGKFVEATMKALALHIGQSLPPLRQFKVGNVVNSLRGLASGTFSDSIRITIPRACEFVYDVASNRGARHDPGEVDPNRQDAEAVRATVSWVLAELLRYSQKGKVTQQQTADLIAGLMQRRYAPVEHVDDRTYFHIPDLSARKVAVLALWNRFPERMTRNELIAVCERHQYGTAAAKAGVARLAGLVDVDANGGMRLLQPGLAEAEQLLESVEESNNG
jgi:hypothetical protein